MACNCELANKRTPMPVHVIYTMDEDLDKQVKVEAESELKIRSFTGI